MTKKEDSIGLMLNILKIIVITTLGYIIIKAILNMN